MDGLPEVFQLLGAGGDAATVALAVVVWRMQYRLMRLELKIFGFGEGEAKR